MTIDWLGGGCCSARRPTGRASRSKCGGASDGLVPGGIRSAELMAIKSAGRQEVSTAGKAGCWVGITASGWALGFVGRACGERVVVREAREILPLITSADWEGRGNCYDVVVDW